MSQITFLQEIRVSNVIRRKINKILKLPVGSFDKEFRLGKAVKRFEVVFANEYTAEVSVINGDVITGPHIMATLFDRVGNPISFLGPDFERKDIRGAYLFNYLHYTFIINITEGKKL
jgi:hypothetical protein